MEFETVMKFIEYIIRILACIFVIFILPTAKKWLSDKIGSDNADYVYQQICIFAQAAEQLLKMNDPDGTKRKEYVINKIEELSVEVNQTVLDMIESAVWNINTNNFGTLIEGEVGEIKND